MGCSAALATPGLLSGEQLTSHISILRLASFIIDFNGMAYSPGSGLQVQDDDLRCLNC
tara:strand:+ start:153 stop:326 length:174 start_codon:yes stop_codon:yes gene_type:complete